MSPESGVPSEIAKILNDMTQDARDFCEQANRAREYLAAPGHARKTMANDWVRRQRGFIGTLLYVENIPAESLMKLGQEVLGRDVEFYLDFTDKVDWVLGYPLNPKIRDTSEKIKAAIHRRSFSSSRGQVEIPDPREFMADLFNPLEEKRMAAYERWKKFPLLMIGMSAKQRHRLSSQSA